MFREAGLDPDKPPQTWPELVDAAKTLTKTNSAGRRQYGYAITGGGEVGNTLFRTLPLMWMNGGDIVSADVSRARSRAPRSRGRDVLRGHVDQAQSLAAINAPGRWAGDSTVVRCRSMAMYQSGPFDIA
jgi:hypothetical protein